MSENKELTPAGKINVNLVPENVTAEGTLEEKTEAEVISEKQDDKSKKEESKSGVKAEIKKTTIGGQALIEGVMMVGPSRTAMAVRKGDGTIHVEEIKQNEKVSFFETVPFVRGCIRFYKMLVTGTGALMRSADISEEGKPDENLKGEANSKGPSRLDTFKQRHSNLMITFAAILGILLSVGLFILLPRLIVDVAVKFMPEEWAEFKWMSIVTNVIEGILRMMIFLIYLINASRLKDVKRVWRYHGAEHKTIACYEAGEPLTVENVMKYPRFHPRCGTAFMFIVLAISIIIYTVIGVFTGTQEIWVNLLIRLVAIPFICGISYEILRFVGRHDKSAFCRFFCKPGLWLQKFTTAEPDGPIIEVAIASLQAVIPENADDDIW